MENTKPKRRRKVTTYTVDVLESERLKRGLSEEAMGKALGLTGRRGYSHLRRDSEKPPKYETLMAAAINLNVVFEHDGLVFGARDVVTPSFLEDVQKAGAKNSPQPTRRPKLSRTIR